MTHRIRDADVERFTEGDCHIFAGSLHRLTGWPVATFSDGGLPDAHAFCVHPDGRAVDIEGIHSMKVFKRTWHEEDVRVWGTPRELARADQGWSGTTFGHYSYHRARLLAPLIAEVASGTLDYGAVRV